MRRAATFPLRVAILARLLVGAATAGEAARAVGAPRDRVHTILRAWARRGFVATARRDHGRGRLEWRLVDRRARA